MPYILETKEYHLQIKDKDYEAFMTFQALYDNLRKIFKGAGFWYEGLMGLVFIPVIKIRHQSLKAFKRLLTEFAHVPSFELSKRGRKIVGGRAVADGIKYSYDGDTKIISLAPVGKLFLDVVGPQSAPPRDVVAELGSEADALRT